MASCRLHPLLEVCLTRCKASQKPWQELGVKRILARAILIDPTPLLSITVGKSFSFYWEKSCQDFSEAHGCFQFEHRERLMVTNQKWRRIESGWKAWRSPVWTVTLTAASADLQDSDWKLRLDWESLSGQPGLKEILLYWSVAPAEPSISQLALQGHTHSHARLLLYLWGPSLV